MQAPSSTTRLVGVIGDPIRHSLSPTIHNAGFEAVGADWVSVAFPVKAENLSAFVSGMRVSEIAGVSVTMPHKQHILELLDEVSPTASTLLAVNSVAAESGRLVGHNTDGVGFVDSLRIGLGTDPSGMRCTVLGAGGAARAVVVALAAAGAAAITIVNRSSGPAHEVVALAPSVTSVGGPRDVAGSELLVNATSVGMRHTSSEGGLPVAAEHLDGIGLLVDLVYSPRETALMAAASARGTRVANGIGMLVHQARHQLERWTGLEVPVAPLMDAVEATR